MRKLAGEMPLRYTFQMAAEYKAKHEELAQANYMRQQGDQVQGEEEERPIDEEADQEPYRGDTVDPPRSPAAFNEPPDWHIDDLIELEGRHNLVGSLEGRRGGPEGAEEKEGLGGFQWRPRLGVKH